MAAQAETTRNKKSAQEQDKRRLSPHGSGPTGGRGNVCSHRLSLRTADAKNSTLTALQRTSSPVLRCLEVAGTEVVRKRADDDIAEVGYT